MQASPTETLTVGCPHCGTQLRVPAALGGKKGRCLRCQGVVSIPLAAAAAPPIPAQVVNSFDDDFADYKLMNEPPPAAPPVPQIDLYSQYAPKAAPAKNYDGAFGMEKRALDAGMLGGLGLLALGLIWLFGGLALGYFFPYSLVLVVLGLIGLVKGMFSGGS